LPGHAWCFNLCKTSFVLTKRVMHFICLLSKYIIELLVLVHNSYSCHLFLQQADPSSTSLLGSNQSTLHDLEYPLPPYLARKYNIDQTANPRPSVTMQEVS
jgi:hypothetical protein